MFRRGAILLLGLSAALAHAHGAHEHASAQTVARSAAAPTSTVAHAHAHPEHHEAAHMPAHAGGHDHSVAAKTVWDPATYSVPFSYAVLDASGEGGRPTALWTHIGLETLAWFVALPLGLAMRAAGHPLQAVAQLAFVASHTVGLFAGALHRIGTDDLYPGSSHSAIGWITSLVVLGLVLLDSAGLIGRLRRWWRDGGLGGLAGALRAAVRPRAPDDEYELLFDQATVAPPLESGSRIELARCNSGGSDHSDDTLHEDGNQGYDPRATVAKPQALQHSRAASVGQSARAVAWRFSLVLGWVNFCTGMLTYTGIGQGSYFFGMLAHVIKGSVFIWFGVWTFLRYLGAWPELGWAWNRRPGDAASSRAPSAEIVECGLIAFYGWTNIWLERLGADSSEPFTIHEFEHISIAVVFAFAGTLGLLLESSRIRRTISAQVASVHPDSREPASYAFGSFSPIPALVIVVCGLSMAAHHQEYLLAVQIHALWGNVLALGGVLRILTYTFLWLRPPTSVLPSRPPTEALAAFALTFAGVVFILSMEEVSFLLYIAGTPDVMLVLNIGVALVSWLLAWVVACFAIKAWAVTRMQRAAVSLISSATVA